MNEFGLTRTRFAAVTGDGDWVSLRSPLLKRDCPSLGKVDDLGEVLGDQPARSHDPTVDRFVAAGAERIFVDARLGPADIVQHWPGHADHLHGRLPRSQPDRAER